MWFSALFDPIPVVIVFGRQEVRDLIVSSCCAAEGCMYITACPALDVVHDDGEGGDQRDPSSTAAKVASFNEDSERIG